MAIARSRITAQGQITVPAEVRRRLGVAPGAVLEWEEEKGRVFVRRSGRFTSEDIHRVLFPKGPPSRAMSVEEMDEGIRQHLRRKHARR